MTTYFSGLVQTRQLIFELQSFLKISRIFFSFIETGQGKYWRQS